MNGQLTQYASGFTMIGDIAFDQAGRLLVLEMDQNGLLDSASPPTPGALIRINSDGTRTVLASTGLEFPGGIAVARDGSIYATNWAVLQGSGDPNLPPGVNFGGEVVRIADPTPADQIGANLGGYREVASDGGVFTFGAFGFYGSMGGTPLNKPVVGIASTPLSPGYWEVASDGGIFSFGTAQFYGSMGGTPLNAPIVGMAATPDGKGYYPSPQTVASSPSVMPSSMGRWEAPTSTSPSSGERSHRRQGLPPVRRQRRRLLLRRRPVLRVNGRDRSQPTSGRRAATRVGAGTTWLRQTVDLYLRRRQVRRINGWNPPEPAGGRDEVTPDNGGYNLAAADGGIFSFGDAIFYGRWEALRSASQWSASADPRRRPPDGDPASATMCVGPWKRGHIPGHSRQRK